MFKRLMRARSILSILSLTLVLTVPTTSKADPASCAQAVAQAAAAAAYMEAVCSQYGTMSGVCNMAIQNAVESAAAMANECAPQ